MRTLYVRVPDRCRAEVFAVLAELEIEYVTLPTSSPSDVSGTGTFESSADAADGTVLLQIPLPADAVGPVLEALADAGVETDQYTIVSSGETAMTSTWKTLEDRYARDYDPLTLPELRSKVMDLSQDPVSYYALMILSALIATAGLLADSPAIVVGSMVIAPVVGPVLTASVGAITDDRRMVTDSLRLQATGLAVTVLAATALSLSLQAFRFSPPVLDIGTIELIGVRLAPNTLALIVGLAAGAAGGIGLTTKGPMSLIGVMIAAALIPTAATSGIGFVWDRPLIGIGTLALLIVTVVAINVACFAALWVLYRPALISDGILDFRSSREATIVFAALAVLTVVIVTTAGASIQQIAFERNANDAVYELIDDPDREDLTIVAVRSEYDDPSPFTGPQTVTVVLSDTNPDDAPPPGLAGEIADAIESRTDQPVTVRVRFFEYQETTAAETDSVERVHLSQEERDNWIREATR